jgi:hypothetical protein
VRVCTGGGTCVAGDYSFSVGTGIGVAIGAGAGVGIAPGLPKISCRLKSTGSPPRFLTRNGS